MGEVLQGREGQSSPSQPGSSSKCDVEDSVLDVNKWVRCCKVGRGRAAPPRQAAAAIVVWGTAS